MLKGVAEAELPSMTEQEVEQILIFTIALNQRNLFDFFDENDVRVFIVDSIDKRCSFKINSYTHPTNWLTRSDAETEAFKVAFDVLENKLS